MVFEQGERMKVPPIAELKRMKMAGILAMMRKMAGIRKILEKDEKMKFRPKAE